jgi:lysozyme
MEMQNIRVVDIFHGDDVAKGGFKPAADAGVWGIIHKASESAGYKDPKYKERRKLAAEAGLLFGAYHFNSGSPVDTQLDNFFTAAQPDDTTLMVLDYEDKPSSQMTIFNAVEFLRKGEERLGRKLAIYSGNRLKEQIGKLSIEDQVYVCSHRLWLCQYGPVAKVPKGFVKPWLWQYTGDGIGPMPHYVPGITVPGGKGIDLNTYDGTRDQLIAEWK